MRALVLILALGACVPDGAERTQLGDDPNLDPNISDPRLAAFHRVWRGSLNPLGTTALRGLPFRRRTGKTGALAG